MTALSLHILGFRALGSAVAPDTLVGVLSRAYRCVADTTQAFGGEVAPAEEQTLLLVWGRDRPGAPHATDACLGAWEILQRLQREVSPWAREHQLEVCPRVGIASADPDVPASDPARHQVVTRAHLLQRLNRVYGTTMLLDDATARAVGAGIELCEIDAPGADGDPVVPRQRMRAALAPAGGALEELIAGTPTIHELLGPRGKVPDWQRGAASAFRGALELFRLGECEKAASIFALLAGGPRPDALIALYRDVCARRLAANREASCRDERAA
jgi:hypothetical protein